MKKSMESKIIERWGKKNGLAERYAEWVGAHMSERQQHIAPRPERFRDEEYLEIAVPHTRQR